MKKLLAGLVVFSVGASQYQSGSSPLEFGRVFGQRGEELVDLTRSRSENRLTERLKRKGGSP